MIRDLFHTFAVTWIEIAIEYNNFFLHFVLLILLPDDESLCLLARILEIFFEFGGFHF